MDEGLMEVWVEEIWLKYVREVSKQLGFGNSLLTFNAFSAHKMHKISDSLVLFFYYGFYKTLDISFHTKILHSPLGRISFVNYRLRHVTEYLTIRL